MNDRVYEIMFIVRPDVEEADLDKLIEGFEKNVTDGGGSIRSTEKMGRRRLAYTVRKFNDGFYVLLTILAPGALITEIERRLRVSEQVIKFITVRIDEEEKRLAKVKAHRDAHVKRSSVAVQPAHPFPSSAPETSAPEAVAAEAEAPTEVAAEPLEAVAETPAPAEELAAEPVSA